ncbi:hypothetical protein BDF20DRAFT_839292 [Mycotypha africana]|uniref:uncharacterized protein n=1 Tax=Mycotypha africana TaxID=64632 RepID=UPI002301A479|nr:uncharacterized protein BDF20DRAFT_839292 [Mycotypha africana]KAI8968166.1 hypothetical protein BDF20DRAFT_839292 [Mycotypha africana]
MPTLHSLIDEYRQFTIHNIICVQFFKKDVSAGYTHHSPCRFAVEPLEVVAVISLKAQFINQFAHRRLITVSITIYADSMCIAKCYSVHVFYSKFYAHFSNMHLPRSFAQIRNEYCYSDTVASVPFCRFSSIQSKDGWTQIIAKNSLFGLVKSDVSPKSSTVLEVFKVLPPWYGRTNTRDEFFIAQEYKSNVRHFYSKYEIQAMGHERGNKMASGVFTLSVDGLLSHLQLGGRVTLGPNYLSTAIAPASLNSLSDRNNHSKGRVIRE